MKKKPKPKPRRVVLGVGHPWFSKGFNKNRLLVWSHLGLTPKSGFGPPYCRLAIDDLGNWNKIRLVAEVLK